MTPNPLRRHKDKISLLLTGPSRPSVCSARRCSHRHFEPKGKALQDVMHRVMQAPKSPAETLVENTVPTEKLNVKEVA